MRVSHAPGGAADRNTFPKTAEMSCYFGLMVPEGEIRQGKSKRDWERVSCDVCRVTRSGTGPE